MMDWADEEAEKLANALLLNHGSEAPSDALLLIASALRLAHAKGELQGVVDSTKNFVERVDRMLGPNT